MRRNKPYSRSAQYPVRLQLESLEDRRLLALVPELVLDANQSGNGALVRDITPAAEQTFFFAGDQQLWRTDGTVDGTRLVVDFAEMEATAGTGTAVLGNSVVFTLGNDLWISDGTAGGTQRLHTDLRLTQYQYYGGLSVEWNGVLYISATNSETGAELWRTDGTAEGTRLVADINPGAANGDVTSLTVFEDQLYFAALDDQYTRDVWKTDGTVDGTYRFHDLPFTGQGVFLPMAIANDTLFFAVGDPFNPQTLRTVWITDGTSEGTRTLASVSPLVRDRSIAGPLMVAGDHMYMMMPTGGRHRLVVSDGTADGTAWLNTPNASYRYYSPVEGSADVNGKLFVALDRGNQLCDYWMSDGTVQGTSLIQVVPLWTPCTGPFASLGSNGYFPNVNQLWKTDGTAEGTGPVDPAFPGGRNAYVWSIIRANDQVLFTAFDPKYGRQLFATDGTAEGTQRLTNAVLTSNGSGARGIAATEDRLFYNASSLGPKIFSSDGSAEDTFPLWNLDVIDPWENDVDAPFGVTPVRTTDSLAFFVSQDEEHGKSLNVSDGSAPTYTRLLTMEQEQYVAMDYTSDQHLFFHFTGQSLSGPWISDGTIAGTHALEGFPDQGFDRATNYLTFRGATYFVATFIDGQSERSELWRFNLATDSAEQVVVFSGQQFCGQLATNDVDLFASLSTPEFGCELWRIDGESFETTLVADLRPGPLDSLPNNLVGRDGELYFDAVTDTATDVYARTLVRLSGDDYTPLAAGYSFAAPGVFANGDYFFTKREDASSPNWLWATDGTSAGTSAVPSPPTAGVHPFVLTSTGGRVFFIVPTGNETAQLWHTDGTPEGTQAIPGLTLPTYEGVLAALNGTVYFSADDGKLGTELWKLAPPPGDTNFDGLVDLADLNNVRNHFGETGSVLGDANGDGVVDLVDLNAVRNYFGSDAGALANRRATAPRFVPPLAPNENREGAIKTNRPGAEDLLFTVTDDSLGTTRQSKFTAKKLRAIDRVFGAL